MRAFLLAIFALLIVASSFSFVLADSEKPNETFWELLNQRDFKVKLTPWPAKQGGEAKIHATAEETDEAGKFIGTVEYRIVTDSKSNAPWAAMKKVKDDKDVEFETAIKLPAADKVFVEFKITEKGVDRPTELTDWSVTLDK